MNLHCFLRLKRYRTGKYKIYIFQPMKTLNLTYYKIDLYRKHFIFFYLVNDNKCQMAWYLIHTTQILTRRSERSYLSFLPETDVRSGDYEIILGKNFFLEFFATFFRCRARLVIKSDLVSHPLLIVLEIFVWSFF